MIYNYTALGNSHEFVLIFPILNFRRNTSANEKKNFTIVNKATTKLLMFLLFKKS